MLLLVGCMHVVMRSYIVGRDNTCSYIWEENINKYVHTYKITVNAGTLVEICEMPPEQRSEDNVSTLQTRCKSVDCEII